VLSGGMQQDVVGVRVCLSVVEELLNYDGVSSLQDSRKRQARA